MRYLNLSFPTPELNLACDEALLDFCEEGYDTEILRFWESPVHFVVLGYSSKAQGDVNLSYCAKNNIPILRRCSGGGTVVQGPGCLNYTLLLRMNGARPIKSIASTYDYILNLHQKTAAAVSGKPVSLEGISDLAVHGYKFSGNAQRRKKNFLLFHGTFLIGFDLTLLGKALTLPEKRPAYRNDRPHKDFVMNLNVSASRLKSVLKKTWHADKKLLDLPSDAIEKMAQSKYTDHDWNFKF